MKISLLVLNDFTNDARVHKEAKALARAGHDVTVIALWNDGLAEHEQSNGYQVHRVRLRSRTWQGRLLAPLVKYIEFTFLFLRYSLDSASHVYHANDANTLPAAWMAARLTRTALVYDAHELETGRDFGNYRLSNLYRRIWAWPEKAFIRSAYAVITVSESIAGEIARLYNIMKPVVILNAPEQSSLPPIKPNRLREEFGIPAQFKIVLYQGRIVSGRGLETLFSAIQPIEGVSAVALGNGPMLDSFREKVEVGLWQRVYFPGTIRLDELFTYTASADIGVVIIENTCLSHYYSLPNKLFEYMQAGIPVIGSNLPEIARVIQEHKIGMVVDPSKDAQLSQSISKMLRDQTSYLEYVANCREASQIYNWERESKKLINLYSDLEKKLFQHSE